MATRSQEVAADIASLLRARNALLWIVTREEARVERYLFEAAIAAQYVPMTWDCGQGVADMNGKVDATLTESKDVGNALAEITKRATETRENPRGKRSVWVMRDMTPWLTGIIGISTCRQLRNLARSLPTTKREFAQAIIVLSPSGEVPPELAGHATVIEWPLPDRNEIASLLDAAINALPEFETGPDNKPDPSRPLRALAAPNGTRDLAIDSAVGLSGEEAASCYAKSLVSLRRIDPLAVAKEKKRIVARERVLEWYDPIPGGLDAVGGLENLKAWLVARKVAYSKDARDYGLPTPKGAMLFGVQGCLRGDVPIYDPVFKTNFTVEERCHQAKSFNVWAKSENGPVVTAALPPQKYKESPMIEVTLDTGVTLAITPEHRFISNGVEIYASEVYERFQEAVPCLLETSSGIALQGQTSGVLRSMKTLEGFLDYCRRVRHSYGGQLRSAKGIAQEPLQQQGGALERSQETCNTDGQDASEIRSPQDQPYGLLSKKDYFPSSERDGGELLLAGGFHKHEPALIQAVPQLGTGLGQKGKAPRPSSGAWESSGGVLSSTRYTRVVAARKVAPAVYYDFHVPGFENYWACGIWHHNCGKSLTAKAVATAWEMPLLKLDMGALRSKFVGDSEANIRKAFRVIEAIGRCVVWLDEVEKALQGATSGSADGGVSSDALGAILTWMNERQGEAFVVATANDIAGLPPEFLRKGRFDEVWWIDVPTETERVAILKAALKANARPLDGIDLVEVAIACREFTGAEIAAIVPDAMFVAFADGKRAITTEDLIQSAGTVIPLSKTADKKIEFLRGWAKDRTRPASRSEDEIAQAERIRQLDLN